MSLKALTIATRESPLALKQTEMVKEALLSLDPTLTIELLPLKTSGDTFLETRLNKIGGKGLFTKELETAMLEKRADLAVHSMKDMPSVLPEGLHIAAILKREDERDAFVSDKYESFSALPEGAIVGTSSLRRESQLRALRPDIVVEPLRGNINTRLKKAHQFDAIILASAGLKRMGFQTYIKETFTLETLLPAASQGALGIEACIDNQPLNLLLQKLTCQKTKACIHAERAVIHTLNGGCHIPIAAHCALLDDETLHIKALVGQPDGEKIIKAEIKGPKKDAKDLGKRCADMLLAKGAQSLLDAL